jgi:tRNA nucleotidyltransferase (CCA-adding enzyme)
LVGGSVIDLLSNRAAKDWDVEVYGLDFDQISRLFPDHPIKEAGAAFGILKLCVDGVDIDINVPRTDNKVGKGHKDFVVEVDPTMSVKEAARRRDFTINTLGCDLLTGEIIDEWGGLADLSAGILRATDEVLFVEDPLRLYRAMQLLPRKAKRIDPGTMGILRSMTEDLEHLALERIDEEHNKLLLKADKPSQGFRLLEELGVLPPELKALTECGQSPDWHPEGDVWTHSLLAVDAAAQIRHLVPESQRLAFMWGVFLHDVGKPATTVTPEMVAADEAPESMLWSAHGHDKKGMDPAESFLRRMTQNKKLIKLVREVVGLHMQPYALYQGEAKKGAYARLSRKMEAAGGSLHLIGQVCQCDCCATGKNWQERSLASGEPNWEHEIGQRLGEWAVEFEKDAAATKPKVLGRDLIARGLKPGREFGKLLSKCLDIQDGDASLSKDEILDMVLLAD